MSITSQERDLLEVTKTLHAALAQQQKRPSPYVAGAISLVIALIVGGIGGIFAAGSAFHAIEVQEKLLERHEALGQHPGQATENRRLWDAINQMRIRSQLNQDDLKELEQKLDRLQGWKSGN